MVITRFLFFVLIVQLIGVTSLTASQEGLCKWHPGHYLRMSVNYDHEQLDKLKNQQNLKGAQIMYFWSDIEVAEGVYDFTQIEKDLKYLQSMNKRLIIEISTVVFNTNSKKVFRHAVPNYMLNEVKYDGGESYYGPDGKFPRRGIKLWNVEVSKKLGALYVALGERFDTEQFLEAINTSESVAAVETYGDPFLPVRGDIFFEGYTLEKYVYAYKKQLAVMKQAFPNTSVIGYVNFLKFNWVQGQTKRSELDGIKNIMDFAVELGAGLGGPDLTIPFARNRHGKKYKLTPSYEYLVSYKDLVPLSMSVMWQSLREADEGYWTVDELYDYGVNKLGLNYITWMNRPYNQHEPELNDIYDVMKVINKREGRINNKVPASVELCKKQIID